MIYCIEYEARDYTHEFRSLPSLAARTGAFQACSGEQRTVERAHLLHVWFPQEDSMLEAKRHFHTCLQLSAVPPVENGNSLSPRTTVLGLPTEFVFSLR